MISGYLTWWFHQGWHEAWQRAVRWLISIADFFSVDILIKTWFAPWKNDVLSSQNMALSDKTKIWEQNFASRFFGFLIRTAVIFVALIVLAFSTIGLTLLLVGWFLAPFLIILLPIIGGFLLLQP